MRPSTKEHDTLVYRLAQVLTKLNQGQSLDPLAVADRFGLGLRIIQRDLNARSTGINGHDHRNTQWQCDSMGRFDGH